MRKGGPVCIRCGLPPSKNSEFRKSDSGKVDGSIEVEVYGIRIKIPADMANKWLKRKDKNAQFEYVCQPCNLYFNYDNESVDDFANSIKYCDDAEAIFNKINDLCELNLMDKPPDKSKAVMSWVKERIKEGLVCIIFTPNLLDVDHKPESLIGRFERNHVRLREYIIAWCKDNNDMDQKVVFSFGKCNGKDGANISGVYYPGERRSR